MSDQFFLKQLTPKLWLGLRQPQDMRISIAKDGKPEIADGWNYDLKTTLPDKIMALWVPKLNVDGSQTWGEIEKKTYEPQTPFAQFEADVSKNQTLLKLLLGSQDLDEGKAKDQVGKQLGTLRNAASLPLRAMQAYRDLEPGELARKIDSDPEAPPDTLLEDILSALGSKATTLTIDLFSGLLFVARIKDDITTDKDNSLFVDPTPKNSHSKIKLSAIQASDRVMLQLADTERPLTNLTILDHIAGDKIGSPYYRLNRSLGIEGRTPFRSSLIVIPHASSEYGKSKEGEEPIKPPESLIAWKDRSFQIADQTSNNLVGELLNYRVELFNSHGRLVSSGRLMVVRQDVTQPSPPTSGSACLNVTAADNKVQVDNLEIRIYLRKQDDESLATKDTNLELVLYSLSQTRIPTGFYGDADDAALAVGRLLGDLDPAAVLASGEASFQLSDGLKDMASARLSANGLEPIDLGKWTWQKGGVKNQDIAKDSVTSNGPSMWSLRLDDSWVKDFFKDRSKGVRLFVALRRVLQPTVRGAQRTLESTVVPLEMSIESVSGDFVANVQHFENFWAEGPTPNPMKLTEKHARVFRSDELNISLPIGVTGSLRVDIDHATIAKEWSDVGGYRLWMREAAGTESLWNDVSILQVLPPLVKAYAPIETGRLWLVDSRSETLAFEGKPSFKDIPSQQLFRVDGQPRDNENKGGDLPKDPADFSKPSIDHGTSLLKFMKQLGEADLAAEYILSVSQRRRLERLGTQLLLTEPPAVPPEPPTVIGDDIPDGNWLFFKDQNGRFLGRAWNYWGKAKDASGLSKRYVLVEVPNAQDSIGVDDFGRASWTWHGLTDKWGHDFEWMVEPLNRYAPLLQLLKADGARRATSDALSPDRYLEEDAPSGKSDKANALAKTHFVHSYRVQRTEVLNGQVGIVQRFDSTDDAFVFKVFAPDEFRLATYNSVARSAYGVLKIAIAGAERKFIYANAYNFQPPDVRSKFLEGWVGDTSVDQEPTTNLAFANGNGNSTDSNGVFAEVIIDEPHCMSLSFAVKPKADGIEGGLTKVKDAKRNFHGFVENFPNWSLSDKALSIPLATLKLSYTGKSLPPFSLVGLDIDGLRDCSLLELPDPFIAAHVYWRAKKQNPFARIATFRGSGLPKPASTGSFSEVSCPWGALEINPEYIDPGAETGLLETNPKEIVLKLKGPVETSEKNQFRVVFCKESQEQVLTPK
jgi:hypothetical protein